MHVLSKQHVIKVDVLYNQMRSGYTPAQRDSLYEVHICTACVSQLFWTTYNQ